MIHKHFKNILDSRWRCDFYSDEPSNVLYSRNKWDNLSKEELDEKELWAKQCKLYNIYTISYLYMEDLIDNVSIIKCITTLLSKCKINQEKIKYYFELIKIIGKILNETNKKNMENFEYKINKLLNKKYISKRIHFCLLDIINLKNNNYNN